MIGDLWDDDSSSAYEGTWLPELADRGAIDPREVLADRLTRQVGQLLPLVAFRSGSGLHLEWLVDLVAGLSLAAECLHAMVRNDTAAAADHMVAALRLLDSVEAGETVVSDGLVWG